MGIDKRNIRAIIHYALANGLEAYVQEMGRGARDGRPAHASLIYSAPTTDCAQALRGVNAEKAREQYGALQPACVSDPDNFRKWRCPYGLKQLCDYGLEARNIAATHESPHIDAQHALAVYDAQQRGTVLSVRQFATLTDAEGKRLPRNDLLPTVQFALYRLQQIGVINGWTVDYSTASSDESRLQNPVIEVAVRSDWTPEVGLAHLRDAKRKLAYRPSSDASATVEATDELVTSNSPVPPLPPQASSQTEPRRQVYALLADLLAATHQAIEGMRMYMLWSEWTYADAANGTVCRRGTLRRVFDNVARTDTESCGSCDICCPDMQFDPTRVTKSTTNAALEQLTRQLPEVFSSFRPEMIHDAATVAREQNALLSVQGIAEQRLVVDPNNLSAIALAGQCAHARGQIDTAMLHFSTGFTNVEMGRKDRGLALYFYEQARAVHPVRALDLLDRRGGIFDTPEGHQLLLGELAQATSNGLITATRMALLRVVILEETWKQQIHPHLNDVFNGMALDTQEAREATVGVVGKQNGAIRE